MFRPKDTRPIVLCGPSGSGKSTLLQRMLQDFPNCFGFSISHTTRKPRSGEVNGEHYHFTTKDDMTEAIVRGDFLEYAIYCNNTYGTSKASVEAVKNKGQICVLDIDVQGVKQIKEKDLNPWYIFIKPPSLDELKARLSARKTETDESLNHRLQVAKQEIYYGVQPGNFDLIIVNDDLDNAYEQLKTFVEAYLLSDDPE